MDRLVPENPPSSQPIGIYWVYYDDTAAGDEHSGKIRDNRAGIINGADAITAARGLRNDHDGDFVSGSLRMSVFCY